MNAWVIWSEAPPVPSSLPTPSHSQSHTHTHTHSLTHRVQGMVCLDILQDQWTPALNVGKVLLSLTCLLQSCNPSESREGRGGHS